MGGAEKILFELSSYFHQNDFQIKVIFIKKSISGYWNKNLKGLDKIYFKSNSEFKGLLSLVKYFLQNKSTYDYVLTSHLHLNGFVGLLRKLRVLKCKYQIGRESTFVFDRFSGFKLLLFKMFYFLGYSKIDLLITQSEAMKNHVISYLNPFSMPKRVQTIPNLFNLEEAIKKSNDFIPDFPEYIVSAGRLITEKGFDLLIQSYKQLNTNKKLIILGEGVQRKFLEELIAKESQTDNIFLLGFVENPMPYFKHAQLCVVSSRVEGFPNVLLQMMALNNNVVSTLCAPGVESLNGVINCKTNDVIALCDAMQIGLANENDNTDVFKDELLSRNVPSFWKKIQDNLMV